MDRNTLIRWVVIAAALILFWRFGPKSCGSDKVQALPVEQYKDAPAFVPDVVDPPREEGKPNKPTEGELCDISGPRFKAQLSSRGGALVHFHVTDAQYAVRKMTEANNAIPGDMSTTPDQERWRSLRTTFRGEGADSQLAFDRFPYKLEKVPGDAGCIFTYQDESARIEKRVTRTERPFELAVETKITNLSSAPKRHQLATGTYAFRPLKDVKGSLGRVSPWLTELSCAKQGEVVRKAREDFKDGWISQASTNRYAAINNGYFTQALLVQDGNPTCNLVAEEWLTPGQARDDDNAATVYHATLRYPAAELAPQASATYKQIAFFGPKERPVLARAGGGSAELGDVINLGFFSPVAKVLVTVLNFFHDKVTFGNWGLAIIAMTLSIRLALFPLSLKSIKSALDMRKLRPEIDELNKKFEGDAQAKNLAMMELYKKRGVNPLGGCLPQLVQMPVWFAMYTTLQTACEMYNTKFLWFADLSAPDRFYIQPLLLGCMMIVQQKIMPPQPGMDPAQQKMMTWLMPIIFTVMMLFMPAALGLYSMTNSALFIIQQLVVERIAARSIPQPATT
jgi:YidC/Oxa1 family membrane protein insertase